MHYVADFMYKSKLGNGWTVEDTKGMKTRDYIIKIKMFLYTRWYPAGGCYLFKTELEDSHPEEKFIFQET